MGLNLILEWVFISVLVFVSGLILGGLCRFVVSVFVFVRGLGGDRVYGVA